ncbi:unnamed protein product [Caenorhabditis sp. 36 PRJEB53466]|nr:unnamed protein product [Caenorhabditis sp. 36 PRJEB53466]
MSANPPKAFAFKQSALAEKADKIWSESKNDFSATHTTVNHVQLEKKSLGDFVPKQTTKEKESEDSTSPQPFVLDPRLLIEAEQEAERAKEAEKQHAGTSAVEVTTGEEADTKIFQAMSKIWVFDKTKNAYTEKGMCTLRINKRVENGLTHHRIVARTSGTLRVIINSKVFSDMLLERVGERRVRISAMGPEIPGVQIFLLTIGYTKTEVVSEAEIFFSIMGDLLKLEKGENSRKRKAECDLNASSVKIRDGKEGEDGEQDQLDEGFVIVDKPTEEEVNATEQEESTTGNNEPSTDSSV